MPNLKAKEYKKFEDIKYVWQQPFLHKSQIKL